VARSSITDVATDYSEDTIPGGRKYRISDYVNTANGEILMKFLEVIGMGHAWSGGSSSGTYTDPNGPDASLMMIDFFSTFGGGNDNKLVMLFTFSRKCNNYWKLKYVNFN